MREQIPVAHESFKDSGLARVNIDDIVYSEFQSRLRLFAKSNMLYARE